MNIRLENAPTTAPTITPVSLLELKYQLRLASEDFADDLASAISIAPGDHVVAAAFSLEGTGVDVLGKDAMVSFVAGACGSGGSVTVKVQDSDDDTTYSDVSTFTVVTEANDNDSFEYQYTGTKQYLRVVATVAAATCDFVVTVITSEPTASDESLLQHYLDAAVEYVQDSGLSGVALITQTWTAWMDGWPEGDSFEWPFPPLQEVTHIKYYGTDDSPTTLSTDDYYVDDVHNTIGLKYGKSWPSSTLRTYKQIEVTATCGFGDATTDIPKKIRQAILMLTSEWYDNREDLSSGPVNRPGWLDALLMNERLVRF